jgi:Ca2+-binding RTX toxin-like protein
LNQIKTGNQFLTLTGDASSKLRLQNGSYLYRSGINNGGSLVVGSGGSKITGTGDTGINNNFIMLFGNGANEVKGIGKRVIAPKNLYSFGLTGIQNDGIMQFGNGNNTLTGIGFKYIAPPRSNQYNDNGSVYGYSAINNSGTIIFGSGKNTVDALAGGFEGDGYIEFGSGENQIKGFGQVSVDGGGNKNSKLLLNPGTYQITKNREGGTYKPFQVTQTGVYSYSASQYAQMDITGIPLVGAASSGTINSLKQGTLTIDKNGKLTYEDAIGNDAYMVYDPSTHTQSFAFFDTSYGYYDQSIQKFVRPTHEVRFASTTAGQLTLFAEDTGVGSIIIGTGTGATAITTATTALNVDASAVNQGLTITGNNGNNKLTGGLGDDCFVASLGTDAFNGGGGVNTADFSKIDSALTIDLAAGTAKTRTGTSINDTLSSIQNVIGGTAADSIKGDAGDNVFTGGRGTDSMDGGTGSDTYVFNSSEERTDTAEINDSGTTGTDTVLFTSTTAGQTLTLFGGDKGIEVVSIGKQAGQYNYIWSDGTTNNYNPEDGSTGTGSTALNIDASAVLNGLTIQGNDGDNNIKGSKQDNIIYGGNGVDTINGGAGNDQIFGGLGNDILTGGAGNDVFSFNSMPNSASNRDVITDFASGTDILRFNANSYNRPRPAGTYDNSLFVTNGYGNSDAWGYTIQSGQFLSSNDGLATNAEQRFIYGTSTGILSYDRDGNASAFDAVQVAVLGSGSARPGLAFTDIRVNLYG